LFTSIAYMGINQGCFDILYPVGLKKFFNQREDGKDLFQYLVEENYHLDTLKLSNPVLGQPNAYVLAEDGIPSKIEGRVDFLKDATAMALDYFDQEGKPFFLMVMALFSSRRMTLAFSLFCLK